MLIAALASLVFSTMNDSFALLEDAQEPAQHVALNPVPRENEAWWADRHRQCVAITQKGGVDVAFLGDSITQGWEGEGRATWDKLYAPRKAANFGFSGDRTEHVLWRLNNGELVGLQPRVVVIMIGTNNVGHGSSNPQQTADGVKVIVGRLRSAMPRAKILLLSIFPRDEEPDGGYRKATAEATRLFSSLHDGRYVFFEDMTQVFTHVDGRLRTSLMPDRLHLNAAGYELWGRAMERPLAALLALP